MPKHILCADDSVTMQKVVAITFAHTDYHVSAARSADEAIAIAQRNRPDLVLADAIMPGKSGYDLCHALKSDFGLRQVPVVIVCGNSQAYDEGRARQVGADGTLTKPWDTQVFIEKIGEILSRVGSQGVAQPLGAAPTAGPRAPSSPGVTTSPVRPPIGAAPAFGQANRAAGLGATQPVGGPGAGVAARPPATGIPPRPLMPPGAGAAPGAALPRPPAGLPRPPLIRGAAISNRPAGSAPTGTSAAVPGGAPRPLGTPPATPLARPPAPAAPPIAATPPVTRPQRSATIMGMPAMALPPGMTETAPARPVAPAHTPPAHAPPAPTLPPSHAQPAPASSPASTLSGLGRPLAPPAAPTQPVALPAPTPPPAAPRPLPGTDALAKAAQRVAAAGVLASQQGAVARGLDPRGVEYDAILKMSREIIEKIAWEVVPELAEIIIRERLHELKK